MTSDCKSSSLVLVSHISYKYELSVLYGETQV